MSRTCLNRGAVATFFRRIAHRSNILRLSGLHNADSSRTLRCANDSVRDSPRGRRPSMNFVVPACRNGMSYREKLTLQLRLDTLGLGEIKKGMRPPDDIPGEPRTDGIFRPAACQRADAGIDLWADRDRLYDGLRHHRHDQLRPWRHLHGRRLRRADRLPLPDDHLCLGQRGAVPADHDDRRDADDQPLQLDDREGRLPAVARLVPAGAADHRDRHVDRAVELRAGHAGPAQQADPADDLQGLRRVRHLGLAEADHHRRRDGRCC